MTKRMKLLLKLTPIILIVIFIVITMLYNHAVKPFEGYDKKSILCYDEQNKAGLEKRFYDYYNEFVDFKKYSEKYNVDFYYKHGRNMIFSNINTDYLYHAVDSYSYIIYLGDDYEEMHKNALDNYAFLDTPINVNKKKYFISEFFIDGWTFKELDYNVSMTATSYLVYTHKNNIRSRSYWFSYNPEKKIMVFSVIVLSPRIHYFETILDLDHYIRQNLYI